MNNNESENSKKNNNSKDSSDVEFADVLRDVAKFAGKTFHDVEKIFGDIYSDFMGKEKPTEEGTLRQKLSDDLDQVYATLGKAVFPHLKQNNAFDDDNLKNIISKIERFNKGLKDLADMENEAAAKKDKADKADEAAASASTTSTVATAEETSTPTENIHKQQ